MKRVALVSALLCLSCGEAVTPDDPFSSMQLEPTEQGLRYRRPAWCPPCAPCDCACADPVGAAPRTTVPLLGRSVAMPSGPVTHTVDLTTPYFMGRYPVTNRCRVLCERAGVCPAGLDGPSPVALPTDDYANDRRYADYPADRMRWTTARQLCQWLGGDLPTVMQWRYAMRGPDDLFFPWGDRADCSRGAFNYANGPLNGVRCRDDEELRPRYTRVDAYPSGRAPFGAFAAVDSVRHWTLDRDWGTRIADEPPNYSYDSWLYGESVRQRILDPAGPTEEQARLRNRENMREVWRSSQLGASELTSNHGAERDPGLDPEYRWAPDEVVEIGARCVWRSPTN